MRRIVVLGLAVGLLSAVVAGPASADVEIVEQIHWQGATATFNDVDGREGKNVGQVVVQDFTPGTSVASPEVDEDPYVTSYYRTDGCNYEGRFSVFDLQWSVNSATLSFDPETEGCGIVEVTWTAIDNGWDSKNATCFSCRLHFKSDFAHHIRSIRFNDAIATLTVGGELQPIVDAGSGINKGDITIIR